jgi:hypothetical protein
MGMVVFRLKGENALTEKLLKKLNSRSKYFSKINNFMTFLMSIVQ